MLKRISIGMGWDLLKNNKVSLSTLTYTFFSVLSLFEQTRSKIVPLLTLQTFFLELVQWLLVNVIGIGEKFFFSVLHLIKKLGLVGKQFRKPFLFVY